MNRIALVFALLCIQSSYACCEDNGANAKSELNVDVGAAYYFLPNEDNLVNPTIGLSWNGLYVEGRYNYESRDTGSIWIGVPYSFGKEIEFNLTPMIGGVIGAVDGMAPGLEFDATWKRISFYIEAEYVFDFASREENFFYSWSELTYALFDKFKIGLAASRTRVYDSAVEIDRGPLAAFETEDLSVSVAVLNVDSNPITVISAYLSF